MFTFTVGHFFLPFSLGRSPTEKKGAVPVSKFPYCQGVLPSPFIVQVPPMCYLPGRLIHIIIWPPSRGRPKGRHGGGGETRFIDVSVRTRSRDTTRHNVTAAFEIDVMRTKKESQKHALSICTSQSAIFFLFSFVLGGEGLGIWNWDGGN